jgi:hypothetical protein
LIHKSDQGVKKVDDDQEADRVDVNERMRSSKCSRDFQHDQTRTSIWILILPDIEDPRAKRT